MGQKTDFNPDEWDFQEESSSKKEPSDTSGPVEINFNLSEQNFDSLEWDEEPSAIDEKSLIVEQDPFGEDFFGEESSVIVKELSDNENQDKPEEKRIYISHSKSGNPISEQEEEAFRKQIEDLFELLELEKTADKKEGIRVYQTDSSPSRPWRFH